MFFNFFYFRRSKNNSLAKIEINLLKLSIKIKNNNF